MDSDKRSTAVWAKDHPVAAGFAVVLIYIAFRRLTYFVFRDLLTPTFPVKFVHEIVDVIWPFATVLAFGCTDAYKNGKGRFVKTIVIGIPLVFYFLYGVAGSIFKLSEISSLEWKTPPMMLFEAVTMLFVGFREESLFRGIAVNLLSGRFCKDRRGILLTTALGAFFFGIMHMQNLVLGQSFEATVAQSVNAAFVGSVFVAVYLRGGNLWAMMILHAFIDASLMFTTLFVKSSQDDAIGYIANNKQTYDTATIIGKVGLCVLCLVVTLFILRKSKCEEITERFANKIIG